MYVELVFGGMKRSPSSRRSDIFGLKTALSKLLSWPWRADLDPVLRLVQKASPRFRGAASGDKQGVLSQTPSSGFSTSNLSKLRSTPFGKPPFRAKSTK
jgi:predicted component of type VI protein secretion system